MTHDTSSPAPWTITPDPFGSGELWLHDESGRFIASIGNNDTGAGQAAANARLIAAAPELLEAFDGLMRETVDIDLAQGIELAERERESRDRAIAAIDKATTGEPPAST